MFLTFEIWSNICRLTLSISHDMACSVRFQRHYRGSCSLHAMTQVLIIPFNILFLRPYNEMRPSNVMSVLHVFFLNFTLDRLPKLNVADDTSLNLKLLFLFSFTNQDIIWYKALWCMLHFQTAAVTFYLLSVIFNFVFIMWSVVVAQSSGNLLLTYCFSESYIPCHWYCWNHATIYVE